MMLSSDVVCCSVIIVALAAVSRRDHGNCFLKQAFKVWLASATYPRVLLLVPFVYAHHSALLSSSYP
jgi:predicted Co/Zn/Cd cation transporter (cation efflux family)